MAPVFYTEHNKKKCSVILITEGRKSHRFVMVNVNFYRRAVDTRIRKGNNRKKLCPWR